MTNNTPLFYLGVKMYSLFQFESRESKKATTLKAAQAVLLDLESISQNPSAYEALSSDSLNALKPQIDKFKNLIGSAYMGKRELAQNIYYPRHPNVTQMTHTLSHILQRLPQNEASIPASVINYYKAERAELPAAWRFKLLAWSLRVATKLLGLSFMMLSLVPLFMLPQAAALPLFLILFFGGFGLTILAIVSPRQQPAEKVAAWLLGKFEDIGPVDNVQDVPVQSQTHQVTVRHLNDDDKEAKTVHQEMMTYAAYTL